MNLVFYFEKSFITDVLNFLYQTENKISAKTTATSCLVIRSTGLRLEMTCVKKPW